MSAGTGAQAGAFLPLVELGALDDDTFHAQASSAASGRVSRGVLSARGLAAAGRTVDTDWRWVHSLHVTNVGNGDGTRPVEFHVERLRDSEHLSTRLVRAAQDGLLLAVMTVSFQIPSATRDLVDDPSVSDDWPDPHSLPVASAGAALDVRYVDRLPWCPTVVPGQANRIWVRFIEEIPDRILCHAAAIVYATDLLLVEPLVGPEQDGGGLAAETLDLSMRLHRGFRADDWLRHEHEVLSTAHGRAVITGRFFSSMGRLVASVSQEIALLPAATAGREASSVNGPACGSRKE